MDASATPRSADTSSAAPSEARSAGSAAVGPPPAPSTRELCAAVAVSGGVDSTALLHAVCRQALALNREHAATLHVWALHVHHGLQPVADEWVLHLRKQVSSWARRGLPVSLDVARIRSQPSRGESIEAWARRERYVALQAMARAHGCDVVLLGQHRRDQAETVLVQALRGGGMSALAAMRKQRCDGDVWWCRPWLEQPHEAIVAYAKRWRLSHVVDPSNEHLRFTRNRLRQQLWPQLLQTFGDAETALAASARRLADEAETLVHLIAPLLDAMTSGEALQVGVWAARPEPVRRVLLRHWLQQRDIRPVPQSLIERVCVEAVAARALQWPLPAGRGLLRLFQGQLTIARTSMSSQAVNVGVSIASPVEVKIDLSEPGRYALPGDGGTMEVYSVPSNGVDPRTLRDASCRMRTGGEQFQAGQGRPARSLKKQYQAAGVAASERQGPVVWVGNRLVFVAGLGIDARWLAAHGQTPGVQLRWHAAPAGGSSV